MTMRINPLLRADAYKNSHFEQYPEGTTRVVSNLTPRDNRHAPQGIDKMVWFGLQPYLIQTLVNDWNDNFFDQDRGTVIDEYSRVLTDMGLKPASQQFSDLHDLGYMPLEIWALPEGSEVDMGIPTMVMWNTKSEFYWLTNFIETDLSANIWLPSTSATTALAYRRVIAEAAEKTGMPRDLFDFTCHDFSYRGMSSTQSAIVSGAAHLTAWNGTDSIPAIRFIEEYYGATLGQDLIAGSVPATEHSVMSAAGADNEAETYQRLLDMYPSGVISIVSDTWDYFSVLTELLPGFKDQIMEREGCVVIRPDSGNPVNIIAGDPKAPIGSPENKGSMQLLIETFGATRTSEGFDLLDAHVGLIYGDSITLDRAQQICDRLIAKNICPSIVLGIGSYTYQYATRDTYGMAIKATSVTINDEDRAIFKDPKTAKGGLNKKSAVGIPAVYLNEATGIYQMRDGAELFDVRNCAYEQKFNEGDIPNKEAWADIVARVRS